jgi:hypothetical protein
VILALTHIMMCGLPAAILLQRSEPSSRARLIGTSFLVGTGIVALVLLAAPSPLAVLVVTIALWIFALRVTQPPMVRVQWSVVDLVTVLLIALHGRLATSMRVGEWDFWAIWGLKARVFLAHGGIDWAWLRNPYNAFSHPDYPPLLPLNYAFVALHTGRWDDRWLGIFTTLFGAALVLIVRELFAHELPRHLAALATLAAASVALSSWIGIAEAPIIAFGSAGLLLMRRGHMLPASVLLGLAACTKNEGLALIVAAGIALVIASRARDVLRLWPAVAVAAPWVILRAIHGVRGDLSFALLNFGNVRTLVPALIEFPPERPMLWVGIAVALAVFVRELWHERFLLVAVALQLLAYLGAYFVTPNPVRWHVQYSWSRIVEHVAVPLMFVVLTLAGAWLSNERADHGDGNSDDRDDDDERDDYRDGNGHDGRDQRGDDAHLHDEHDRQHG